MKKHIAYLITDANRTYIQTGYCDNIIQKQLEIQTLMLHSIPAIKCNRIVYFEKFQTSEEALKKKAEWDGYTHMMKERIIRKNNPNWLDVTNHPIPLAQAPQLIYKAI